VLTYCQRAQAQPDRKETRTVRKLTPITLVGKATEKGIEEVAKQVLAPHFHAEGVTEKKVKVQPSFYHCYPCPSLTAVSFLPKVVNTT
jgi:hypothetical protein